MMTLPDAQADTVADYLAEHFPTQPGTEPALIPGSGIRTTHAAIWGASIPQTGEVREWPSPGGPDARPTASPRWVT